MDLNNMVIYHDSNWENENFVEFYYLNKPIL